MFLLIIVYGYILVAAIMTYIILRDWKNPALFFGRNRVLAAIFAVVLFLGIITALYSTLIEPFSLRLNKVEVRSQKIIQPIKIAFVSDIQIGKYKKASWTEKIVAKIESVNPDIVIFGGDQIDNEGTFEDESLYLTPLKKLSGKYPVYYILGNHEYGIGGNVRFSPYKYTGDRSQLEIDRMKSLNISLLRNQLDCLKIKKQKICLFGIDDIWKNKPNYSQLKNWDKISPLIYITHNPDGILNYPTNLPPPALVLAGHTHGGQIWLPFIGPLGHAQTILDDKYYRGLNYFNNIPIYTSVGAGESGAPLRLFTMPEVAVISVLPQ